LASSRLPLWYAYLLFLATCPIVSVLLLLSPVTNVQKRAAMMIGNGTDSALALPPAGIEIARTVISQDESHDKG